MGSKITIELENTRLSISFPVRGSSECHYECSADDLGIFEHGSLPEAAAVGVSAVIVALCKLVYERGEKEGGGNISAPADRS